MLILFCCPLLSIIRLSKKNCSLAMANACLALPQDSSEKFLSVLSQVISYNFLLHLLFFSSSSLQYTKSKKYFFHQGCQYYLCQQRFWATKHTQHERVIDEGDVITTSFTNYSYFPFRCHSASNIKNKMYLILKLVLLVPETWITLLDRLTIFGKNEDI